MKSFKIFAIVVLIALLFASCELQWNRATPDWSSGQTYALNDHVSYSGAVYTSAAPANQGNVPSTSPRWWVPGYTEVVTISVQ